MLRTRKWAGVGVVLAAMGMAGVVMCVEAWGQGEGGGKFVAADVAGAGDVAYPPNTTVTGLVSFLVKVDESGAAQEWRVAQDMPPLTGAAVEAVKKWTFHAATWNGKNVAAYLPVHVVFNPYNPGGTAVMGGGPQVPRAVPSNLGSWMPPQVRMASYAFYPTNTQAQGTVVLSVEIGKAGHVGKIRVVQGVAGLNDAAIEAVKQWGFQPAMRDGQTGEGRVCVAFVFQRNLG